MDGSCQFCLNSGALQHDFVITGGGSFFLVGKIAADWVPDRRGIYEREEGDITEAFGSCSTVMGVAKSGDMVAGIVISAAPVVAVIAIVWTELHHSKGNQCPGKGVTVFPCANERIDKTNQLFGWPPVAGKNEQDQKRKQQCFVSHW